MNEKINGHGIINEVEIKNGFEGANSKIILGYESNSFTRYMICIEINGEHVNFEYFEHIEDAKQRFIEIMNERCLKFFKIWERI